MSYVLGINNIHFDEITCIAVFKGNKKAVIQGTFPASTMKVVFKEDQKEVATYFNADGTGNFLYHPFDWLVSKEAP